VKDYNEGRLLKDYKQMVNLLRVIYVSPIDYVEIDSEVRNKVDELDERLAVLRNYLEESKRHLRRIRLSKIEYCV